jgi:hypothetical protein
VGIIFDPQLGGSVMVQAGTLSGNTSGASTYRATNLVLEGGSNVTLQVSSNRLIFNAGGGTGTGGAASLFSNSNGVSWGTAGTVVTATVRTDYASSTHTHGQYLATDRAGVWSNLGVSLGTTATIAGVQYTDWVAGTPGYFMWIRIP